MVTEMDELGKSIVKKWFDKRFENRTHDPSYFQDWIDRFETGHPWTYMDSPSLHIYLDIITGKSSH